METHCDASTCHLTTERREVAAARRVLIVSTFPYGTQSQLPDFQNDLPREHILTTALRNDKSTCIPRTGILTFLPEPVKAFGDIGCIDRQNLKILKYFQTYSYDACVEECKVDFVISQCGCKDMFSAGDADTCPLIDFVGCVFKARDNFSLSEETICNCVMPCEVTKYDVQLSTAFFPRLYMYRLMGEDGEPFRKMTAYQYQKYRDFVRANWLELRVYFDTKLYTVQEQVLEFTDSDLWGCIGGYLGLFLGASLHSALELCEFLSYTSSVVYRKLKYRINRKLSYLRIVLDITKETETTIRDDLLFVDGDVLYTTKEQDKQMGMDKALRPAQKD
ncbi:hypothetical protein ScPMuIL_010007 [Solemya velum]